jgi:7-cyano-7-deazaguanine synthase
VGASLEEALFIEYGQRHEGPEKACAEWWCDELGLPLTDVPVSSLPALGDSALVDTESPIDEGHDLLPDLPASFVPGRNVVLLTLAMARAVRLGARVVYAGMCQTDFSGYPDCRRSTIDALETTLTEGLGAGAVEIRTPQMFRSKAETFVKAYELDRLGDVVEHTHTCYEGDRSTRHVWGYGCGECPACGLRAEGFQEFMDEYADEPVAWTYQTPQP